MSDETKTMGISDARANLTEVVNQVRLLGEPVVLVRRDKPQAAVVPVEWLEWAKAWAAQQGKG
ncbi:type II toxin-antitoxin system Phd/YefM family antitoxin [Nocardiopsis dassonvillei]|uniref:type II toxin-antitoxin system Phd/YefM family antitoxin n=1 Tax=Nocardiopsis dassonvillei TaxID=2014 RepID=UPI003701C62C